MTDNNNNDQNTEVIEDVNIGNLLDPESIQPPKDKTPENPPIKKEKQNQQDNSNDVEGQDDDKDSDKIDITDLLKSFNTEIDNPEHKEIKEGLLKEFKGTAFDAEGNIIDKDGKVLKSIKDITEYLNENEVLLDDKGNQVDEEGKVIKTKAELEKEKLAESSQVNKLHLNSPYEFLDVNGEPKVYEDTDEGFNEYAKDLAKAELETLKTQFFNQNPLLAEISKHLLTGGTLENFHRERDYSKLKPETLSKEEKLNYIRESYEIANFSKERIDRLIQLSVDSNTVDKDFKDAVDQLTDNDKKIKEERDLKLQAKIEQDNQKVEQYWNEVESTIKKGNLGIVNIPENEKAEFFDYLSTVVDDKGNSKEAIDRQKMTTEQKLALAYLGYKGFDLSKLVKNKAQTLRVDSIREKIKRAAKVDYSSSSSQKNSKTNNNNEFPTIDELLP